MYLYLGVLSYNLFREAAYSLYQNYLLSIDDDCIRHKLYMKTTKWL